MGLSSGKIYHYRTLDTVPGAIAHSDLEALRNVENEVSNACDKFHDTASQMKNLLTTGATVPKLESTYYRWDGVRSDPEVLNRFLTSEWLPKIEKNNGNLHITSYVKKEKTTTELGDSNGDYTFEVYTRNVVIFEINSKNLV